MAGRLSNCRYCRFLLVIMTLVLTGTVLNMLGVWYPLPMIAAWWDRVTVLSDPRPAWSVRLGGPPDVVTVLPSGYVVAASYGTVTAYRTSDGAVAWTYDAYWALSGGDVVVLRQKPKNLNQSNDRGYSVVDPGSGAVIWGDPKATAVWAFNDRILDLTCPDTGDCQLRARAPREAGRVLWTAALPASARALKGAAPGLVSLRDPARWFEAAAHGAADDLPGVIGLRSGDTVQLIDTAAGRRVREAATTDQRVRLTVSGERLLVAKSDRTSSGCRYALEGHAYDTDASKWRLADLDLGTGSGTICEQREDPTGAGNRVLATRADNHPVLISATDGTVSWDGVPGETMLATDGQIAVVLAADHKTVRVLDLLAPRSGGAAVSGPIWTGQTGLNPHAAVTENFVVIRDPDSERIVVLSHFVGSGGTLRTVKEFSTRATVVAVGASGLVLNDGRRIGYVPL